MSTLETNLIQPSTGTTLTLGASGDSIVIPSGATITNNGTQTGFGGGKLLQIINTETSTPINSNNTLVATGITASITPASTSSKILVMVTLGGIRNSTANTYFQFKLYRQINGGGYSNFKNLEGGLLYNTQVVTVELGRNILDTTHNTTNQIDYQIYFMCVNGSGHINIDGIESSTLTLMEIGA